MCRYSGSICRLYVEYYQLIVTFCDCNYNYVSYVAVLDLGLVAERLVEAGLKPSTQKTYLSAQKSYIKFCDSLALTPVPTSNATLLLYVSA